MHDLRKRLTGLILAGGRNSRFPHLKSFIKIEGVPIIEKNLRLLKGLFDEVLVSANDTLPYQHLGVTVIKDSIQSRGPLSGIYSCLKHCQSEGVFVVACDMPLLDNAVIEAICNQYIKATETRQIDALVPIYKGLVQPLCAIYCHSSLKKIQRAILADKVTMVRFLEEIDTHYMDVTGIIAEQTLEMCFSNINTPEDLQGLRKRGIDVAI